MIEFTTAVPNVWVYFSHEGQTDVIYHAKLHLTGVKSGYTFTAAQGFDIDTSSLTEFTPFEQITQEVVASWIETQHANRIAEMKADIESHIDESISPTREMRTLSA